VDLADLVRAAVTKRRAPWLRFALVGVALFALDLATPPAAAPPPPPASAALDDDALLVEAAFARGLHERDDVVRRRLARNLRFVRPDDARGDDALIEEALRLGLHESDLVVRRRLAQKMRLLLGEAARAVEPSGAELEAYLAAHAGRFTEPARILLSQRWFDSEAEAKTALAAGGEPRGEAIALPGELPSHSEAELAARFGPAFAAAAFAAPDGRWSGPIASSYGHHLVRVRARTPARRSPLAAVRSQVREALLAERADAAVRDGIAALRGGG
jgi:hypothetical protein